MDDTASSISSIASSSVSDYHNELGRRRPKGARQIKNDKYDKEEDEIKEAHTESSSSPHATAINHDIDAEYTNDEEKQSPPIPLSSLQAVVVPYQKPPAPKGPIDENTKTNIALVKVFKREIRNATEKVENAIEIATEAKKEAKEAKREATEAKQEAIEAKNELNNALSVIQGNNEEIITAELHQLNPSSEQTSNDKDGLLTNLSEDTYTLMMTKRICSRSWFFGLIIFAIQMGLLFLIFEDQVGIETPIGKLFFSIPFKVSDNVRAAQFLAIFISIMISSDIFMPMKDLSLLWISNYEWTKVISGIPSIDYHPLRRGSKYGEDLGEDLVEEPPRVTCCNKFSWLFHILLPNILKFIQGLAVLLVTFIIVMQSENIIDLFKDFAALQFISELDNISFHLASHGFFGGNVKRDTKESKKIQIVDIAPKILCGFPLRPFMFLLLLCLMMGTFVSVVVIGQRNGLFFSKQFPNCHVTSDNIAMLKDGKCNGGVLNSFQCGFDGGDCLDFNMAFPNCKALNAYEVGDGVCQREYNTEECGYDGGDCCPLSKEDTYLGDGQCHGGAYLTETCAYDHGDCDKFRYEHPLCPDLIFSSITRADGKPMVLGDGICDFVPEYMVEECDYEYGDCSDCKVTDPSRLGDGICDGGSYNTASCGFDLGDCEKCNQSVFDFSRVGDGICDGVFFNIDECNWDAGDCKCFNDATAGQCDIDPGKMLVECKASCQVSPLLGDDSAVFQLQSKIDPSLCLSVSHGDDTKLLYNKCSASNLDQSFSMKNKIKSSGKIYALTTLKSNSCLQMVDSNLQGQNPLIMDVACTDTWEILDSGVLKNVLNEKCIGKEAKSRQAIPVDCDSDDVENWYAIDSQYELFNIHFKTMSREISDRSEGPFEIDGYGEIPKECHQKRGAQCTLQIYGMKTLTIRAKTSDAWHFTITGDIGDLLSYETVQNGEHFDPFPTKLDEDEYDVSQTYGLKIYNEIECFNAHLKSLKAPKNTNNFQIDGYGYVPNECYSDVGAECDVQVCGRRTLVIKAFTPDEWKFEISGDVGSLQEYKTVPEGTHQDIATMDINEHDYLQVYNLVPKSSCAYRAIHRGECEGNSDYMKDNCATTCNFMPLFKKDVIRLQSTSQPSMCLTAIDNVNDFGIRYSECDDTNLYQYLFFETVRSDIFSSFGSFHLSASLERCLETDKTDYGDKIVVHSDCTVTWEVLESGALKSIEEGKCMGKDESDIASIRIVDCDSEDVEIWSVIATQSSFTIINVALYKVAIQSSNSLDGGGFAALAVDGDIDGDYDSGNGSVTLTSNQNKPWWSVHLDNTFDINIINVFNRRDCCDERLNDFILTISNEGKETWTYQHSGTPEFKTAIYVPEGIKGDKVQISLDRFGYLSLTEVEVYARNIDSPPISSAPTITTSSIQTQKRTTDLSDFQLDHENKNEMTLPSGGEQHSPVPLAPLVIDQPVDISENSQDANLNSVCKLDFIQGGDVFFENTCIELCEEAKCCYDGTCKYKTGFCAKHTSCSSVSIPSQACSEGEASKNACKNACDIHSCCWEEGGCYSINETKCSTEMKYCKGIFG